MSCILAVEVDARSDCTLGPSKQQLAGSSGVLHAVDWLYVVPIAAICWYKIRAVPDTVDRFKK